MKRFLCFLLCISLLCVPLISCGSDPEITPTPEVTPVTYDGLVAKYTEALTAVRDGADAKALERTGADGLSEDVVNAVYDTVARCGDPTKMGYGKKDIDGDGKSELLLMAEDGTAYALFGLNEQAPILLFSAPEKGGMAITDSGLIYRYGYTSKTDGDTKTNTDRCEVYWLTRGNAEGFCYECDRVFSAAGTELAYYKVENGNRTEIDKGEYDLFLLYYMPQLSFLSFATAETLNARFFYTPVFATEQDTPALAVSFATYDDVIEVYKKAVELAPDWKPGAWKNGNYRGLLFADHQENFALADRLLEACKATGAVTNGFGYVEQDLDGNGQNELILQNGNREIVAIFTLLNTRVQLLYANTPDAKCLIGEDGRLYIERHSSDGSRAEIENRAVSGEGYHFGLVSDSYGDAKIYSIDGIGTRHGAALPQDLVSHRALIGEGGSEADYRLSMLSAPYIALP